MPPLYDVEAALQQVRARRESTNLVDRKAARVADRLARHMLRHFPNGTEDAGVALIVAAASVGVLAVDKEIPPAVLVNIVGFAGARLIEHARTGGARGHG